jgi:hypothetical protein
MPDAASSATRYLDRAPMTHAEFRSEVIDTQIAKMQERGIWAKPAGPKG